MTNSVRNKIIAVMKNDEFLVACSSSNGTRGNEVTLTRMFGNQLVEQNPIMVHYDQTEIELSRDLLHSVLGKIA